jgi:GDP-L-fucose synthase
VTIEALARLIMRIVGFEGELITDTSKPDGTPRKLMDSATLLSAGWLPSIELKDGLFETYVKHFLD